VCSGRGRRDAEDHCVHIERGEETREKGHGRRRSGEGAQKIIVCILDAGEGAREIIACTLDAGEGAREKGRGRLLCAHWTQEKGRGTEVTLGLVEGCCSCRGRHRLHGLVTEP
jgi:hypothetical protein